MRVISGKFKGKILMGDHILGTRPTQDRVKESVFARIQNQVKGAVCLDLFAGSGALGIEALSNGASCCYFIDHSATAVQALKENLKMIDDDCYHILKKEAKEALKEFSLHQQQFDLIFLDPPYDDGLLWPCLIQIVVNQLLKLGGQVICEFENENFTCADLELKHEKKYGAKKIRIYERTK